MVREYNLVLFPRRRTHHCPPSLAAQPFELIKHRFDGPEIAASATSSGNTQNMKRKKRQHGR
jgi:hypothetical protein